MAKFTDLEKKSICADYIDCQNYSEVARKYNVSVEAIRRVVKENDEVVKKLELKKEENTQSTLEYMQTQHETKKRILDKLLHAIEVKAEDIDILTNIKDLATAYGIILDKELKVLEINKGIQEKDNATRVMIINSLPKDDDNEQGD